MLTPEHAAYLENHAVTVDTALNAGVFSVPTVAELPEEFAWYGEKAAPAIGFPWTSPKGEIVLQLRPDRPPIIDGEERKYLFPRGAPAMLNAALVVPGAVRVLLVEGTKQHLAAASWAPADTSVYGLMGCWSWVHEGGPIPDLAVVDGKEVVICFDADLGSNLDVWKAAGKLEAALKAEGAVEVAFVKLPATGKAGLDDVLAQRDPDRRAAYLGRLVDAAGKLPGRPRGKKGGRRLVPPSDGRARIVVTGDQYMVINAITDTLVDHWSGGRLFNHGETITERRGHVLKPLDKGSFLDLIQETARVVLETEDGDEYAWPHPNCVLAALTRADKYAPLHRISRVPFVRPDGSICQLPGYDEPTGTFLVSDLVVDVPDEPTPEQIRAAADLIMRDWFVDMSFAGAADRANALALCITPIIRGLVDLAPLAVIDGLQMGVGKNLLTDCISILVTGEAADPLPYSTDNEEMRKLITAAFRAGSDFIAFDEAHLIEGNALARTLTTLFYTDRVLGVSTIARFPNRVTWMSLGNQVQIKGDVARRVYPIALRPAGESPELRGPGDFRYADLRQFTRDNRAVLLGALLTLVRGWFVAGRPPSIKGSSFGSFEAWGRMVGGIVELAGETDFLENIAQWRSDSDFETSFWASHIRWLKSVFGNGWFTCGEVRRAIINNPETAEAPPGMEDTSPRDYARVLGQRYARQRDKILYGYKLIRSEGATHDNTRKWMVLYQGPQQDTPSGGKGVIPNATHIENTCVVDPPRARAHTRAYGAELRALPPYPHLDPVAFDLETAGLEMWSYGPGFVRLAGYRQPDGVIVVTPDIGLLPTAGVTLTGHNIWGFDLLALARWHGLDLATVEAIDTKLLAFLADPPPAKMNEGQIETYYSLDSLGERLLGVTKAGDIKAMAKQHGGFDRIPLDDPEYLAYCRRDVELAAALVERLPLTDYARREHEIARITAIMSLNGFRVDGDLLGRRVAKGRAVRAEMLERLKGYGLPSTRKDGSPCSAPQSTEEGRAAIVRAFDDLGVTLPLTPSGQPALDQKAMGSVIERHPKARALAETIKSLNGVRSVYETVERCTVDGRVHPMVNLRQATGRWSVTEPGLTVMGKRNGRYVEREILLPEPGHVMIAADLSQVDARAVAALSGDAAYLELFDPGRDAHAEIATRVWGDPERREDAKVIGHGWNYGMGHDGIVRNAGVSHDTAEQFDRAMRDQFPDLVAWRKDVRMLARAGETLDNGFGRKMRPDPARAHTQGPALMGQGAARDILMDGLLRMSPELIGMLRAVVHDEVVLSVPEDIVDDVEREVVRALSFEWMPPGRSRTVQVVAGLVGRGPSWGSLYEKGS